MDAVNHIKLSISRPHAIPTLRALLYAIFFQRSMDTVEPETYDVGDAHVACAPSAAVEKEVAAKLEEFAVEYLEPGLDTGEIAVVFLQKRPRKGWFAVTEELIPWELHLITLTLLSAPSQDYAPDPYPSAHAHPSRLTSRSPSLVPALAQVLAFCAEKRYNVPVLSSGEGGGLSHRAQIMINPPPPSELFSPSPPTSASAHPSHPPARALSPPPTSTTSTTATTAHAGKRDRAGSTGGVTPSDMARRGSAPSSGYGAGYAAHEASGGTGGYLEQAKDGLRAVRAGAGVVAGWAGRGK